MEQGLTPQSEEPQGSRNGSRAEEETRERLSSMIQEKRLTGCVLPYEDWWVLLAESSTDRFVVLDGINFCHRGEAHNDEYKLVAAGNAPLWDDTRVYWPGAEDLANVVHEIIVMKRLGCPSDVSELCQKTADLGLPIYDLDLVGGWHARLRGPEEQGAVPSDLPWPSGLLSDTLCMLSRVLRPPSALSAGPPSLLAQSPLDDTAASSSAPLDLVSVEMDNNRHRPMQAPEAACSELAMHPSFGTDIDRAISSRELAAARARVVTRSSGQRSRNGGGSDPAATELLADNDLEAGRQAPRVGARRIGGGATAPVQEPLDLVSVRMDNSAMHPPFGTDMYFSWGHLPILIQGYASSPIAFAAELAAALQHVVTRSSGPHGRNGGGGDPAATEFLVRPLELLTDYDLEAGREAQRVGAWRPGGGAAAALQHVTRSSGRRSRNGGSGDPAATELLVRPLELLTDYDLEAGREAQRVGAWRPGGGAAYDLEAGREAQRVGAWRPGGGAAAPVQEPSDMLQRVLEQFFAAFLPGCAMAYSLLKDAPDHVKFIIFGGLAFIIVSLFVGMLSNSVARRGLAIRLASFSAAAVLTFSVAAQLSSPIYIALTALVGVAVNLIIMLLRF